MYYIMSYLILAMDNQGGIGKIGKNGGLPWPHDGQYKLDMQFFRETTKGHAVIMGFGTFQSLKCKPLPDRLNIVVTNYHTSECSCDGVVVCDNLDDAVTVGHKYERDNNGKCFVMGGAAIYDQYMKWYNPSAIYYSRFDIDFKCDKFVTGKLLELCSEYGVGKSVLLTNTEEQKYLDLFQKVLATGHIKGDRTGTGTYSLFSPGHLEFDLSDGNLPVLTTKRVALKTGVIPELLWFLSGKTDTRILEQQGCNIWKGNTSEDFLRGRGLPWQEKDLGPGYGFQWRHCGAQYHGMDHDYTGVGVDQVHELIEQLNNEPDSRRMVMCSWIPYTLKDMALPPCHILYQLYTYKDEEGERCLEAKMYQRSADSFLGVPFNISSYAILTHMIAAVVGMEAKRLIFTYGDYHIYSNHVDQVRQQLIREPRPFPKIRFNRDLKGVSIFDVTADDFQIVGYNPYGKISAPMAL